MLTLKLPQLLMLMPKLIHGWSMEVMEHGTTPTIAMVDTGLTTMDTTMGSRV